jgi:sulfur carrier protein ThiS
MSTITLVVIPGPGARTVTLPDGATLQDLVVQENLHGRDLIVNGQGALPAQWSSTLVESGTEIFATGSVKGNSSN